MKPFYLHDFSSKKAVAEAFYKEGSDWAKIPVDLSDCKILLVSYSVDNYTGNAFVLFEKDGNLYEVNGCHCSCYGLEGQWEPEETSLASLKHRYKNGRLGDNEYSGNMFKKEILEVINFLKNK